MSLSDDQSYPIKNIAVDTSLLRKPVERIAIAFYLEAVHTAIHHNNIYPGGAIPNAKFIQNKGVTLVMMFAQDLLVKGLPDVAVSHFFNATTKFATSSGHYTGHVRSLRY